MNHLHIQRASGPLRPVARFAAHFSGPAASRGLTLVELMVAMAIGLLIVMVATAVLVVSQRGAVAVDGAAQLRDDARFATELIQRLAVQTGFEDVDSASAPYRDSSAAYKLASKKDINELLPNVYGFNNARASATEPLTRAVARTAGDGGNGSDVLILRYQTVKADLNEGAGAATDESIINCNGVAPTVSPLNRDDRVASILYLGESDGEPALMCITQASGGGWESPQPILKGVENFQVLYGVDNVAPGVAPPTQPSKVAAGSTVPVSPRPADSVPDRYLRADRLTVPGNAAATYANWRRVRSLRIGLVLRGPVGSAHEATGGTFYPLGNKHYPHASDADPGSKMVIADTAGSNLTSRLRQTVTFTVQLRNCQNQGYQPESSEQPCDVVLPQASGAAAATP